ncbi:MAG: hypothetical protein V8T86_07910 [Victivallis sp.]
MPQGDVWSLVEQPASFTRDWDNAGGAGDPMPRFRTTFRIPDAVLACVPLKGLEKFDLRPTDTVVVVGAGMARIPPCSC